MVLIINGDDGSIGLFIKTIPTGRDGWVDVLVQPPSESFMEVLKCLFRKPQIRFRGVPESCILGPEIVGPPDNQRQVMFMTQGEGGSSKLLDRLGVLQNKALTTLRSQLQDEIIRAQSAEEEKSRVLKGAKSTQKMLHDLSPAKDRGRFSRDRGSSWGESSEEEF